MGFFDALFGTNTNDSLNKATTAANANTTSTVAGNAGTLNNAFANASGALNSGANSALSSLLSGYTSGNNALTSYGGQAQGALTNGVNSAVGTVQGSNAQYAPYVGNGQNANTMYANSLGLNGAAGNTAATGAFQASPGYQFQVDQATDAAARKAASLGMAGSGNTLDAITRLGSNLANTEYGNWQSNLNGLSNTGLTAANAVSGNNATAGGYQYGGGGALATLLQQLGTSLNTNATGLGTAQANVQNGLGTNLANLNTGLGNSLVNNQWTGTNSINGANLADASAQDATDNANNGIFSKLIGSVAGDALKAFTL
jgi:hypothetical protein